MPATLNGNGIVFGDGSSQVTTATPVVAAGTLYGSENSNVVHNTTTWKAGSSLCLNVSGTVRCRIQGWPGSATDSKGAVSYCAAYFDIYKNGVNLGRVLNHTGSNAIQTATLDVSVSRGDILQVYLYVQYSGYTSQGVLNPGISIQTPIALGRTVQT